MIVIANRTFKCAGEDVERGQELDLEETLASRLVRTRFVVEPDRTDVKMRLVVTHRPVRESSEEVVVKDGNGKPIVDFTVCDGAVGKEIPRLIRSHERKQYVSPYATVHDSDADGSPMFRIVRYRTQTQTTSKRGFEWFKEWLSPGDEFPDDDRLTPAKRRNLMESGWIKEVPLNGKPKAKKKPKGKRKKNARRKRAPTVPV